MYPASHHATGYVQIDLICVAIASGMSCGLRNGVVPFASARIIELDKSKSRLSHNERTPGVIPAIGQYLSSRLMLHHRTPHVLPMILYGSPGVDLDTIKQDLDTEIP